MNRSIPVSFVAAAGALGAPAARAELVNVALGRPVSVVQGVAQGEAPATLTDGLFLPSQTQWQTGTVWWEGAELTLEIGLGGEFDLVGAVAQVDDNDAYTLQYRDLATGVFLTLWDVPNYDQFGNGMLTRPDPDDDTEVFLFGAPVRTDTVRLLAASGDNAYSASEAQVFIVPAPGAGVAVGFAALIVPRRRRS